MIVLIVVKSFGTVALLALLHITIGLAAYGYGRDKGIIGADGSINKEMLKLMVPTFFLLRVMQFVFGAVILAAIWWPA